MLTDSGFMNFEIKPFHYSEIDSFYLDEYLRIRPFYDKADNPLIWVCYSIPND